MLKKTLYNNDLYACFTKRKLANILSTKDLHVYVKEIRNPDYHFLNKKRVFYQSKSTKEIFDKKPKDYSPSKYREFNDSCDKHKKILKRLGLILSNTLLPKYLFSKKEKDYKSNALYHLGNTKFILLDINSFFPNCKFRYVKDFFAKESGLYMSKIIKDGKGKIIKSECDVADKIAKLVTVPVIQNGKVIDRIIPQGYPTSTIVSFLSYKEMFDRINEVSNKYNCRFSTYVDDLTFSYKDSDFNPNDLIADVMQILFEYGHSISEKKVRIIDIDKKISNDEKKMLPIITGIVVKRYAARASSKMHLKMNVAYKKYISMGNPKNAYEYIKKWNYIVTLNGMYNTIEYIEPNNTHINRMHIYRLIKEEKNKYVFDISIKRIKLLKMEQQIYDAYKNNTLRQFVRKNKDKLIEYK